MKKSTLAGIAILTAIAVWILIDGATLSTAFVAAALVFVLGLFGIFEGGKLGGMFLKAFQNLGLIATAIAIFLALRLAFGIWLGILPSHTRAAIGSRPWDNGALSVVLWEMLFAIIAGSFIVLWAKKKKKWPVRIALGVCFIVITARLVFPLWASTWESRQDLDKRLKAKGLSGVIKESLGGGTNTAAGMKPVVYRAPVWDEAIHIPPRYDRVSIELSTNRWTGLIYLPWEKSRCEYRGTAASPIFVLFDGEKYPHELKPGMRRRLSVATPFRVSGEGELLLFFN